MGQEISDGADPGGDWTFGGDGYDEPYCVLCTSDGGFLVAGHSDSNISGEKTQANIAYEDFWIVKLTKHGTRQWDHTYGGSRHDEARTAFQLTDGGYGIIGDSDSSDGDNTEPSRGGRDYWLLKVDGNGNKLWDHRYGGPDADLCRCAIQTADGGFLLAGASWSGIGGDKSESSRGYWDYWAVKVDSNGTKQWDRRYGGSAEDEPAAAIQTADGGYLLVGFSRSGASGDKSEPGKGLEDYWVVKLDSNGTKQWDRTIGGQGNDVAVAAIQTTDGGFLIAGNSNSSAEGDKTEPTRGQTDYWLVKLGPTGILLWDRAYGGDRGDYAATLIATSDGGYLFFGESESRVSGEKSEPPQGGDWDFDYWALKLDSAFNKQWDRRFGGTEAEFATTAIEGSAGSFLLAGYSYSDANGDKTLPSRGFHDYWLVLTDGTSPVSTTGPAVEMPEMKRIPADTFVMGNATNVLPSSEGWVDELPQHAVNLDEFLMDEYEVTRDVWSFVKSFADSNGYTFEHPGAGKQANHPIHSVSWYDALKWCNARSERERLRPVYYTDVGLSSVYRTGNATPYADWSANGYRLPTEAEWEKAARGGSAGHRFPWNDTDRINPSRASYYYTGFDEYDDVGDGDYPDFGDNYPYTAPVGYFAPNAYGLYDMAGNVQEWCWDKYWSGYYAVSPVNNPAGSTSWMDRYRVRRGGSWNHEAEECRVAARDADLPASEDDMTGFRCVKRP